MRNVNKAKDLGVEDVFDKPELVQDIHKVRELVNPRHHPESHDAHMATLQHHGVSKLTDEQLLSRLVKGFFGGWVFTPEAKVLAFVKPGDRPYTKLQGTTVPAHIWRASDISAECLPSLHTVLFGEFRLANIQIAGGKTESEENSSSESYVDFVFGSDQQSFSGCHRLIVSRLPVSDGDSAPKVIFKFASMACDPQTNRMVGPKAIITFHRQYASMLFREAVGYVNETCKNSSQ